MAGMHIPWPLQVASLEISGRLQLGRQSKGAWALVPRVAQVEYRIESEYIHDPTPGTLS